MRIEHPNYKNENINRKYLNNMPKNQFLKVMNSLLELEKDFMELEGWRIERKRSKHLRRDRMAIY